MPTGLVLTVVAVLLWSGEAKSEQKLKFPR